MLYEKSFIPPRLEDPALNRAFSDINFEFKKIQKIFSGASITDADTWDGQHLPALESGKYLTNNGSILSWASFSGSTDHSALSNLGYAASGHTGFEPTIAPDLSTKYWRGDKTWQVLNKTVVGLGNVLNVEQEPVITGSTIDKYWRGDKTWVIPDHGGLLGLSDNDHGAVYSLLAHNHSGIYEPVISAGTVAQYWRGDKSWQTLTKEIIPGLKLTDSPIFAQLALDNGAAEVELAIKSTSNALIRFYDGATAKWTTGRIDADNSYRITETGVGYRMTFLPGGAIGVGTVNPTVGKFQIEHTPAAADVNKPTLATYYNCDLNMSGYANFLVAVRTGGGTPLSPAAVMHCLQQHTEDNSTGVIDLNSGALSQFTMLIGNNTGGATSHPDYWVADDFLVLPATHDCIPRMLIGRNISIEIHKAYTIPDGGCIRGYQVGCNYGPDHTQKGNEAFYAYGRWERGFHVCDDDANNAFLMALYCGNHGIQKIRRLSSNPAVADLADQELCLGVNSGTRKIFWRDGSVIYVWNHDATIT